MWNSLFIKMTLDRSFYNLIKFGLLNLVWHHIWFIRSYIHLKGPFRDFKKIAKPGIAGADV